MKTRRIEHTREASELRFPPGHWPATVTVAGLAFAFYEFDLGPDDEILSAGYRCNATGDTLTVWND